MKIEYAKKSYKKRERIFVNRLKKQTDDLIRDIAPMLGVRIDDRLRRSLLNALVSDALEILSAPSSSDNEPDTIRHDKLIQRISAITKKNGLEYVIPFEATESLSRSPE